METWAVGIVTCTMIFMVFIYHKELKHVKRESYEQGYKQAIKDIKENEQ